jgi:quinol monooxygenase YgiN
VPLFKAAKGCHGMQIQKSIENPLRYRLIVDWETVEDHTVHFRQSDAFRQWRGLVGEFFAGTPVVEHTNRLAMGFEQS